MKNNKEFKSMEVDKMTEKEWMHTLTLEQRRLAISTIFTKNTKVLDDLRSSLLSNNDFVQRSYYYSKFYPPSNENMINQIEYGSSASSYASLNTRNNFSTPNGQIKNHLTFIDTIVPEDTLSFSPELVDSVEVFFDVMEKSKSSFYKKHCSNSGLVSTSVNRNSVSVDEEK